MSLFSDVIDRTLPDDASTVVAFFPAVPITIAGANISGKDQYTVFYWVLGSVILSTMFAFFGYYVSKAIRLKTTILSFFLWLLLFIGFTNAGIGFEDKTEYGLGVLLAIAMLFSIIVYFLFGSIFDVISSAEKDELSYQAKEFSIKCLVYLTLVLCIVSLLAIPMTLFLSNPTTDKVLIAAVVYKKRMLFCIFSCTNSVRQFILSAWLLKLLIVGTVEVKISLNLARRPTINSATAAMIVVNKAAKTPQ